MSQVADLLYKVTDYWAGNDEREIAWDDPDLGINWPLNGRIPLLSARDEAAPRLDEAEVPEHSDG